MTLKADDLKILYDATPTEEVKKRQGPRKHEGTCPKFGVCPQNHMMLDYVDARYVMDKLDHLGPENWQDLFVDRPDGSVRCGIGIHVGDEWIWKWDVGTVSDIEPEKGAHSEAFKRAGVKWGIARDLYGHKAGTSGTQPAAQARPAGTQPAAQATRPPAGPNEPPVITDEELASLTDGPVHAVPKCPVHKWDMRPDSRQGHVGEYGCSGKTNGEWCKERAR